MSPWFHHKMSDNIQHWSIGVYIYIYGPIYSHVISTNAPMSFQAANSDSGRFGGEGGLSVHNISLSHPFTVPLQWVQGHQMAWWHTEQPDRSTSSFRVAPGARVTAGGVGLKFLLLWIDCLCLRSCYCFASSMSVVGLRLAHWGCHYHSFWTWLLLKPLTKRPNINNQLRSPV